MDKKLSLAILVALASGTAFAGFPARQINAIR
jgi:hypothetical protein